MYLRSREKSWAIPMQQDKKVCCAQNCTHLLKADQVGHIYMRGKNML